MQFNCYIVIALMRPIQRQEMSKQNSFQSDLNLINAIKNGGKQENEAITFILENPKFRTPSYSYLYNREREKALVDEIYVESIMILDSRVKRPDFELKGSLSAFLTGICKNVLRSKIRSKVARSKIESIHDESGNLKKENIVNPEEKHDLEELKRLVAQEVEKLSEPYRSILLLWNQRYSFDEIAEEIEKLFGKRYSNDVLRQYCHRTKNKLIDIIKAKSWFSDFSDSNPISS